MMRWMNLEWSGGWLMRWTNCKLFILVVEQGWSWTLLSESAGVFKVILNVCKSSVGPWCLASAESRWVAFT